jgi:hypothetical protein
MSARATKDDVRGDQGQRLMRHSSIAVTVGYYANVEQAVEVLGGQCNKNGNTGTFEAAAPNGAGAESAIKSAG